MARLLTPTDLDPTGCKYAHEVRARFAETDAMGIVHHASYLLYLEEARVAWLRDADQDYATFHAAGHDFAVLEVFTQYVTPVRFDDVMTVHLRLAALTRSTFQIDYLVIVDDSLRLVAATVHACVTRDGRPTRLPAWLDELA